MPKPPDWLLQPIAHRGLHDAACGVIENTPSAFEAAQHAGYAIETDLRAAACGTPMVFHDATLERLTQGTGLLAARDAATLRALRFRESADRMPTLAALLDQVGGRVPLFLEVKSNFTDQTAFAQRIAADLRDYDGPVALMSFDPRLLGAFREFAPHIPRGLGATRVRADELPQASTLQRIALTHLLFIAEARPHFISCEHTALGLLGPVLARRAAGLPAIAWTVRTPAEADRALRRAGAIIFEGFMP
ncbi:glycerophosphodiester phosphodiesterase family protein [Dichotomicrobium thermohalophilum]|uniref:Glycerophosphoryl diester phosphodiesterase n=1 Tax=Dichotomicrobium thermohalophilum TaxID=933063 RepID=A0A397PPT2_9HYPH|nr:glycerophosphodiester phosphodiesterase family protein [Dichotomicrobium thermohalophilum]RIA47771.1 glycerophosphoryl diester phosphodiesterase [Dichotomicrobium thermohalophilum]